MRSVSVVSRATCSATGEPVVVKAYELARMRAKDSRRLAREIAIMRRLDRMEGMARLLSGSLHAVTKVNGCCQHTVMRACLPVLVLPYQTCLVSAPYPHAPHSQLSVELQVELYAVIDDETHVYLVMEYCRGGDLFKRLAVMGGCMEEGWVSSQACPL